MRLKLWLLAGSLLLLAGCAATPPKQPAAIVDKSRQSVHAYAKSAVQCQAQSDEEFCHVVERGDSLYSISRRYGLKVVEIASRNNIEAPYIIRPKDLLVVRLGSQSATSTRMPQRTTSPPTVAIAQKPVATTNQETQSTTTWSRPRTQSKAPSPRPKPTTPVTPKPSVPTVKEVAKTPTKTTPARPANTVKMTPRSTPTKSGWRWPVPYEPLPTSDATGLDYRLADGTKIVAATKGKVIYAGAGLNKYRHLIIVDSQTSYLVAYEFNTSHGINEGQNLSGGEMITTIAQGGSGDGSAGDRYQQFHFEIWSNGKPLNPQRVIAR